jgi:hypothetical protein
MNSMRSGPTVAFPPDGKTVVTAIADPNDDPFREIAAIALWDVIGG